jgi:hypothetical protein
MDDARYEVLTWDMDLQQFTPQQGLPPGPFSLFGLRRALRTLRAMGYGADRDDCSTLVRRVARPGAA